MNIDFMLCNFCADPQSGELLSKTDGFGYCAHCQEVEVQTGWVTVKVEFVGEDDHGVDAFGQHLITKMYRVI